MKEIPLTRGFVAIVDDEDFENLSSYSWHAQVSKKNIVYARRDFSLPVNIKRFELMHRVVLGLSYGNKLLVDHINRNGLDNRRENLRICTLAENNRNRGIHHNNTSGFKGVSWRKHASKWTAAISTGSRSKFLGYFDTPEEASEAYKKAAVELHGEFASFGDVQIVRGRNGRVL